MIGEILAVFVVLGIFAVVASLLCLYAWRVDPNHVTVWRGVLRARREGREMPPT
jgi:hypothetical protein